MFPTLKKRYILISAKTASITADLLAKIDLSAQHTKRRPALKQVAALYLFSLKTLFYSDFSSEFSSLVFFSTLLSIALVMIPRISAVAIAVT